MKIQPRVLHIFKRMVFWKVNFLANWWDLSQVKGLKKSPCTRFFLLKYSFPPTTQAEISLSRSGATGFTCYRPLNTNRRSFLFCFWTLCVVKTRDFDLKSFLQVHSFLAPVLPTERFASKRLSTFPLPTEILVKFISVFCIKTLKTARLTVSAVRKRAIR